MKTYPKVFLAIFIVAFWTFILSLFEIPYKYLGIDTHWAMIIHLIIFGITFVLYINAIQEKENRKNEESLESKLTDELIVKLGDISHALKINIARKVTTIAANEDRIVTEKDIDLALIQLEDEIKEHGLRAALAESY